MARQHTTPILLKDEGAVPLTPLSLSAGPEAVSEAAIQQLIQAHPGCLPIAEIDPTFVDPVPICTELNTTAGPIDNFMVTANGLPVLVECKLWRNPEMRRQVVSQILDYAKELSRWSSSDLQREASRRLGRTGNVLLEFVRAAGHEIDEAEFNDALTANLRRGRFLLLIVGDGIREGVEAITEYLQVHAGLHFTLGLVELPIFTTPSGERLVLPRVLARTHLITRVVVAAPDGHTVQDEEETGADAEGDADRAAMADEQQRFWKEFLDGLNLDDPEQRKANPTRQGAIYFPMPGPGSVWLTVYRNIRKSEVGLFLSYTRGSDGQRIVDQILSDWDVVRRELGGTAHVFNDTGQKSAGSERKLIMDAFETKPWTDPREKARAFEWLRRRTNEFLNTFRPRVRAAAADLGLEIR